MAFSMMSHAFRMLWANLGSAARVSVLPLILMYVALFVLGGGMFLAVGGADVLAGMDAGMDVSGDIDAALLEETGALGGLFFVAILILFLVATVFFAWIAISWHRFILLEEYPQGWLPPFRWTEIKAYVVKLILLILVFMAIMVIPAVLLGGIGAMAGSSEAAAGPVLFFFAAILILIPVFLWISFRLSSVLPAAAVARPMGIGEAWRETQSHSGTIFLFALAYLGVSIAIQIVVSILGLVPIVGIAIAIFGSWFTTILGFSALTTVYGVAIEGRELT
ncbi:MAG: hypothetical protein AAGA15_06285 [Pseudomonadota bacterium]